MYTENKITDQVISVSSPCYWMPCYGRGLAKLEICKNHRNSAVQGQITQFSLTSCYSTYIFLLANITFNFYLVSMDKWLWQLWSCVIHLLFICRWLKYNVYCQYWTAFPVVLAVACGGWNSSRVMESKDSMPKRSTQNNCISKTVS